MSGPEQPTWRGPDAAAAYLDALAQGRERPSLSAAARGVVALVVPFVLVGVVLGVAWGLVDVVRGRA